MFAVETKLNLETDSQADLLKPVDGHVSNEGVLGGRTYPEDRFSLGSAFGYNSANN